MNLAFMIIIFVLSACATGWSKENKAVDLSDEKALMQELENLKDPFISPLGKKKVDEQPVPPPVEPVKPPVVIPPDLPPPLPPPVIPDPVPNILTLNPLQDPAKVFNSSGIKVSGIIWNTDLPQAIINDRVVRVGDEINGAKISLIEKTKIDVTFNNITYNIYNTGQPNENIK